MSKKVTRFEIFKNGKGLAFGDDHACGEFLQIWDTSKGFQPDVDNILVDEDTVLTGLTRKKYLSLIEAHGFTEDDLTREYKRSQAY